MFVTNQVFGGIQALARQARQPAARSRPLQLRRKRLSLALLGSVAPSPAGKVSLKQLYHRPIIKRAGLKQPQLKSKLKTQAILGATRPAVAPGVIPPRKLFRQPRKALKAPPVRPTRGAVRSKSLLGTLIPFIPPPPPPTPAIISGVKQNLWLDVRTFPIYEQVALLTRVTPAGFIFQTWEQVINVEQLINVETLRDPSDTQVGGEEIPQKK